SPQERPANCFLRRLPCDCTNNSSEYDSNEQSSKCALNELTLLGISIAVNDRSQHPSNHGPDNGESSNPTEGCPCRGHFINAHVQRSCYCCPSTVTVPTAPSIRSFWPVFRRRCTSGSPATAGKPNSRATIAPCESTPPVSITSPRAWMKSGTQAGS